MSQGGAGPTQVSALFINATGAELGFKFPSSRKMFHILPPIPPATQPNAGRAVLPGPPRMHPACLRGTQMSASQICFLQELVMMNGLNFPTWK